MSAATVGDEGPGWLDDADELIGFLRSRGFVIGTGEALRATHLLRFLTGEGRSVPPEPAEAALWLAPLLCHNEAEQSALGPSLAAFARAHQQPTPPPAVAASSPAMPSLRKPRARWAVLAALLVLAAGILGALLWPTPGPGPGPDPTPQPILAPASATSWFSSLFLWIMEGFARICGTFGVLRFALPPFLLRILYLRWRRPRRPVLGRLLAPETASRDVRFLEREPNGAALFEDPALGPALQALRTHRLTEGRRIDLRRSVQASVRALGQLTLVAEQRPTLPDYPLLVEEFSNADHLALLAQFLFQRIIGERVDATLYGFSADLRRLRTSGVSGTVSLGELRLRHFSDTILMVGEGDMLLDRVSGQPRAAASHLLTAWENVVLLTPVPQHRWSWRERQLAEAGLIVLPLTMLGLELLGDYLRGGGARPRLALEQVPVRPTLIAERGRDALEWLLDTPEPEAAERAELLAAIATELPKPAFDLLCVLALFPEMRADLTFRALRQVTLSGATDLADEDVVGALAALPWFRHGRLPDWLRLDLVRCLDEDQRDAAKRFYAAWLENDGTSGAGATIEIATDADLVLAELRRRVARGEAPPQLRDTIFLHFSRGGSFDDLDLEAPAELARSLRPGWRSVERISLLVASLGALVMASAAWLAQPLSAHWLTGSTKETDLASVVFLACLLSGPLLWHVMALWPISLFRKRWFPGVLTIAFAGSLSALLLETPIPQQIILGSALPLMLMPAVGLGLVPASPTSSQARRESPQRPSRFSTVAFAAAAAFSFAAVTALAMQADDVAGNQGAVATAVLCGLLFTGLVGGCFGYWNRRAGARVVITGLSCLGASIILASMGSFLGSFVGAPQSFGSKVMSLSSPLLWTYALRAVSPFAPRDQLRRHLFVFLAALVVLCACCMELGGGQFAVFLVPAPLIGTLAMLLTDAWHANRPARWRILITFCGFAAVCVLLAFAVAAIGPATLPGRVPFAVWFTGIQQQSSPVEFAPFGFGWVVLLAAPLIPVAMRFAEGAKLPWAVAGQAHKDKGRPVSTGDAEAQAPSGRSASQRKFSLEDDTYRRIATRIIPVLVLAGFVGTLLQVDPAPSEPKLFAGAALSLSRTIFYLAFLIALVPAAKLSVRLGSGRWLALTLLAASAAAAATAFATDFWSVTLTGIMLAVSVAGIVPGVIYSLMRLVPEPYRARAISLTVLPLVLSPALAAAFSTVIQPLAAASTTTAAETAWLAKAVATAVVAVLAFLVVPNEPSDAKVITPPGRFWLGAYLAIQERREDPKRAPPKVWGTLIANAFAIGFLQLVIGPSIRARSDWVDAFALAIGVAVMLAWGRRYDSSTKRLWLSCWPLLLTAVSVEAAALSSSISWLALCCLGVAQAANSVGVAALWTSSARFISTAQQALGFALIYGASVVPIVIYLPGAEPLTSVELFLIGVLPLSAVVSLTALFKLAHAT